ncbi:hypothetical protein C8Q78DRAFT_497359 [Trametes maxima]|nr:hypothetical protein C8Q78DRAFT_497359 [Trametes maxima]
MSEPGTQTEWVPTVDDLRVKLCYICREEERYDNPENPPRVWTHPCACTLVAHESCLLAWIKSAQEDSSRSKNALKCPQCGAKYELESDNPLPLRVLNALNDVLSSIGKAATVVGILSLTASFGFTVYIVSTSYGAFAVKEFLGQEMYDLLLSDDISKWPWHAFIHLPIIPLSLILSRTHLFPTFPLVPLLLSWSTSPPVAPSRSLSLADLFRAPSSTPASTSAYPLVPALSWPPTPLMTLVLFPFIRSLYRRAYRRFGTWLIGPKPPAIGGFRRVIWALDEEVPVFRMRLGADIVMNQQNDNDPAPNANANADNNNDAPAPDANANANAGNRPRRAGADADDPFLVNVTLGSIGRFIGGALLLPSIANRMGALLFSLARHSPLLRAFLAIRERAPVPPARLELFGKPAESALGFFQQAGRSATVAVNILCGGTPTWNAHDPVWWRNAVGLGLFVVARDCAQLLHLWLSKRELESRRVKSRSFAGVDISELELIHPPLEPTSTPAQTEIAAHHTP